MKRLILAALLSVAMVTPCHAESCHDLVMSYIYADQDRPTEPGDKLYTVGDPFPVLMETTGYCHGTKGSHGDRMRSGYCAAAPDMYGAVVMCYEAIEQPDGSFDVGEYLDTLEIEDIGYGYPTGENVSTIRPNKKSTSLLKKGEEMNSRISRARMANIIYKTLMEALYFGDERKYGEVLGYIKGMRELGAITDEQAGELSDTAKEEWDKMKEEQRAEKRREFEIIWNYTA